MLRKDLLVQERNFRQRNYLILVLSTKEDSISGVVIEVVISETDNRLVLDKRIETVAIKVCPFRRDQMIYIKWKLNFSSTCYLN